MLDSPLNDANLPAAEVLAEVTRSGQVESFHLGHLVVCDASGSIVESRGDPKFRTYMRSSAKPLQALTVFSTGADEFYQWTDRHRAVVCASHSSELVHRQTVEEILERARVEESDLRCGPHPPISQVENDKLVREFQEPTPIYSNCSGKHSGMLACCQHRRWNIADYWDPNHPLQLENVSCYSRWSGANSNEVSTGLDGCGVPTFFVSLESMATVFARLGAVFQSKQTSKLAINWSTNDKELEAAGRVIQAMRAHPLMVAGTGRWDTQLGEFSQGRAVSKAGAEGLFCMSIPELGLGLALKVLDGSGRPTPAIVWPLLERYLADLRWKDLYSEVSLQLSNTVGQPVGEIRSTIT